MKLFYKLLLLALAFNFLSKSLIAQSDPIGTARPLPILYYDFEVNSSRNATSPIENSIEAGINQTGGIILSPTGFGLTRNTGAGNTTLHSGFTGGGQGNALQGAVVNSVTDPGTGVTQYFQLDSVDARGFSGISIQFDAFATAVSNFNVLYSINGGGYTALTPVTGVSAFQTLSFVLPVLADSSRNIKLRFYSYRNGTGTSFRIDNLMIRAGAVLSSKTLINMRVVGDGLKSFPPTATNIFIPSVSDLEIKNSGTIATMAGQFRVAGQLALTEGTFRVVGTDTLVFHTGNNPISRVNGLLDLSNASTLRFGFTGALAGNLFSVPDDLFFSNTIGKLRIQRTNAISLGNQSISVSDSLIFTSGILITSSSGFIRHLNVASGSITGASATSHVRGPLSRILSASISVDGTDVFFPVGDGAGNYRPTTFLNIRTGGISPEIQVRINSSGATTTNPLNLTSIRSRNWFVRNITGDFTSATLRIDNESPAITNGTHLIGRSDAQSGDYNSIGGTVVGSQITSNPQELTLISGSRYFAIGFFTSAPTVSASSVGFSFVTTSSMILTWTNGNGSRRIVVAKALSAVDFVPSDLTDYSGGVNTNFTTSTDVGNGNKIVFDGTGNTVSLSGLTTNTIYHFRVYEYNGGMPSLSSVFLTGSFALASQSTSPSEPLVTVSNITFSNISTSSFTVNWTVPTSNAGERRLVTIRAFSDPQDSPTDGITYTTNPVFGLGQNLGSNNYAVYDGTGTSVTITGLSAATRYAISIFEYNGSGAALNYNTNGALVNRFTIFASEPTTHIVGLNVGTVTKNSVQLNWSTTVPSASGYVVVYSPISVTEDAQDGFNYTDGQVVLGTNRATLAVTPNSATSITVNGLNSGTSYEFRVYPFRFDGSNGETRNYYTAAVIPSITQSTNAGDTYVFEVNGGDWTTAANWNPDGLPGAGDIVQIPGGFTVINLPASISIGRLEVSSAGTAILNSGAGSTTITLTGSGTATPNALSIIAGRTLSLASSEDLTIVLSAGATGLIAGTFSNPTTPSNVNRLIVTDSAGLIVTGTVNNNFNNNGLFIGSALNSVVFQNNSIYSANNANSIRVFGAAAPNSIPIFNTGSIYRITANARIDTVIQNRRLRRVELTSATFNQTSTSSGFFECDSLAITAITTQTPAFNFTGGLRINNELSYTSSTGSINFNDGTINVGAGSPFKIRSTAGNLNFGGTSNFVVNNTGGIQLLNNASPSFNSTLTLTNGNIISSLTAIPTIGSSATVNGGSAVSYIEGPLRRVLATTTPTVFPIGKGGVYNPLTVVPQNATSVTYTAEYFNAPFSDVTSVTAPLNNVSILNYYNLTRAVSLIDAQVVLSWDGTSGVSDLVDLRVARWNGSSWVDAGVASTTGNASAGTIRSGVISIFPSNITLGSTSTDNPLPVELATFTHKVTRGGVELKWETISEANNAGFTIQRRGVGVEEWSSLGFVRGNGTTSERKSYTFTDKEAKGKYEYRLAQVDFDGTLNFSSVIEVNATLPREFALGQNYPNPFNPSTTIRYDVAEFSDISLRVYDILGREVATLINQAQDAGTYQVPFQAGNLGLSSGVYFYRITAKSSSSTFVQTKKMMLLK
ncbi:MAG: fibronectin type III domain-containing protein [Chloroherpetonaceae bacterium]|nr:fibronectin type III domain-containing protein [Chloroherpetonaceae bacterium]